MIPTIFNRLATRVLLSLGALLLLVGLVMALLVRGGFQQTETRAVQRSQSGLEAQARLALLGLAQNEAALINERMTGMEGLARIAATQMALATADLDSGADDVLGPGAHTAVSFADLSLTDDGFRYDADPNRPTDVWMPGFLEPTPQRERLLRASAALDSLLPALYAQAEDAVAVYYSSIEIGLRYYPPVGVHEKSLVPATITPEAWRALAAGVDPAVTPGLEMQWTAPYVDRAGQGIMVTLSMPIYLQNEPLGTIGIDVLLDQLVARLEALRPTPGSYAFLVDGEGRLIAAPARALPHLFPDTAVDGGLEALLGEIVYATDAPTVSGDVAALLDEAGGVERITLEGDAMLMAHTMLDDIGWRLGIVTPVDEIVGPAAEVAGAISADADSTFNRLLLTMGGFLLAALAVAAVLTRQTLVKPVEALAAGSRRVAAGDLDVRIAAQREDELGLLAKSFNQMAAQLATSRQELETRVADRTRELTALYDVTAVASASLELDEVLSRSLAQVMAVMECGNATIHLLDEADGKLHLALQEADAAYAPREAAVLASGEGLAGAIFAQNRPQVVVDLQQAAAAALAHPLPPEEQVLFVGVPMNAKGRVLGVLSIFCSAEQDFSVEEVALLASIADQVGIAVENARLYRQTEQLAVIQERQRLARELHDAVTQSLYSSTLLAEAARRAAERGDLETAARQTARLGEIGQQALKEMRLLVYELRPLALKQEGLIGAVQQRLDAVEKRAGLEARLLVEGETAVPADVEAPLYRITQEALNNALKHAGATAVTVTIRAAADHVALTVADNGRGFDPETTRTGGIGLHSMRERVAALSGTLKIEAAADGGTVVSVSVPLNETQTCEQEVGTPP